MSSAFENPDKGLTPLPVTPPRELSQGLRGARAQTCLVHTPTPAALFICPALQAPGEPLGLPQPGLGRVWLWGGGCLGGLRRSPTQRRGVREHSGSGPLFPSCHPFVFPRGILRPRKELLPPTRSHSAW